MERNKRDEDESSSARGGEPASDDAHTESGAPTDEAHREAGDGALTGSIPAGLTPAELRKVANDDQTVEPGTG